jgi:hypothetical protein
VERNFSLLDHVLTGFGAHTYFHPLQGRMEVCYVGEEHVDKGETRAKFISGSGKENSQRRRPRRRKEK